MVKLFKHQKRALRKTLKNDDYRLFMDMGTGKTLVAIKAIEERYKRGEVDRAIIFVPKSIIFNWEEEIEKFLDVPCVLETLDYTTKDKREKGYINFLQNDPQNLRLKELHELGYKGTKKSILKKFPKKLMILLVNYDKARIMNLHKFKPNYLIVDESHKLKNRNAKISKKIYGISKLCDFNTIMTGTPICNGYEDLFMQYKISNEDIFGGRYKDFENRYIRKGGFMKKEIVGYRNEKSIIKKLRKTSYRVKLEDCIDLPKELPPLKLYCELTGESKKAYKQMKKDMVSEIEILKDTISRKRLKRLCRKYNIYYEPRESYYDLFIKVAEFANNSSCNLAVTKLIRMQQITGGFIKMDSGKLVKVGEEKLKLVKDFLDGHKKPLVIFCQFISEIEMLQKELSKTHRVESIMGKTKNIKDINKRFQNGKIDILICQIKKASVGLNLFRASKLMFYSWNFSYDDFVQTIARIKRNGQKERWQVIYLIAKDTVDEDILKVINDKGRLARNALDS